MSTAAAPETARPPGTGARRRRFATMALVLGLSLSVIALVVNILATRFNFRLDVTATGEQQLAPRTRQILGALKGPHQIVIAETMRSIDRRVLTRIQDTVEEFSHENPNILTRFIDVGSPSGRDEYAGLIRALLSREKEKIETQVGSVRQAMQTLSEVSAFLEGPLSDRLILARDAIVANNTAKEALRQFFEQKAAAARLASRDLEGAGRRAEEALNARFDEASLPATDVAAKELARALEPASTELDSLSRQITSAMDEQNSLQAGLITHLRQLLADVEKMRDRSLTAGDEMARMPRLDIARITDALRSGSVALVIGPVDAGVTAVDMDALFPASYIASGMSGVDIGRRSEDLLSVALASLSGPPKPIVVVVHAEQRAVFAAAPIVDNLSRRLAIRGIDLLEWACVVQDQPPGLARLNPDGKRPVIYVSVPPDSAAAGDGKGQLAGVQRAEKLAQVLDRLANDGKNLLVCASPSVLPTTGNADPTLRVLERFSLMATSGRTLLSEEVSPQGSFVEAAVRLQPTDGPHAITKAIHSLPMYLPWPIDIARIATAKPSSVQVWPLITLAPSEQVWSESQWLKLWSTPEGSRAQMADPPRFDPNRDLRQPDVPTGEPQRGWTLGVAAELPASGGGASQRLIVIGSSRWFIDYYAFKKRETDGRVLVSFPGNVELFEASVSWLAHQDDAIAQSPSARLMPVVRPMSAGERALARWGFIAGLPILTLLLGLLHRALRG